jgi:hypothetical protein
MESRVSLALLVVIVALLALILVRMPQPARDYSTQLHAICDAIAKPTSDPFRLTCP